MIVASGIKINGDSVSGISTCISLPQFDMVLDIGECPSHAVENQVVLITHAHADHMGAAHQHAAQRALRSFTPTIFVVPPTVAPQLAKVIDLWDEIQEGIKTPCTIVPLAPGQEFKHGKYVVVAFDTHHRLPSQGYHLIERREKLDPQYEGQDIAALRRSGVKVTNTTDIGMVTYTGDTKASVWYSSPQFAKAKVVITEATYIDDSKTVDHAHAWGHTHINEIYELAPVFNDTESLVLTHFSARYNDKHVTSAINNLQEVVSFKVRTLSRVILEQQ